MEGETCLGDVYGVPGRCAGDRYVEETCDAGVQVKHLRERQVFRSGVQAGVRTAGR